MRYGEGLCMSQSETKPKGYCDPIDGQREADPDVDPVSIRDKAERLLRRAGRFRNTVAILSGLNQRQSRKAIATAGNSERLRCQTAERLNQRQSRKAIATLEHGLCRAVDTGLNQRQSRKAIATKADVANPTFPASALSQSETKPKGYCDFTVKIHGTDGILSTRLNQRQSRKAIATTS